MADFKILRFGSKGPQTELLQLGLTRAGYATAADGIFGSNTQKSLIAFQKAKERMEKAQKAYRDEVDAIVLKPVQVRNISRNQAIKKQNRKNWY